MEKLIDSYIIAREEEKRKKELEKENIEKSRKDYAKYVAERFYSTIKTDIENGVDYWYETKDDYRIANINQESAKYFAEYLQEFTGFPCYESKIIKDGRREVFIKYPLMK
jgi:hypothetical protein